MMSIDLHELHRQQFNTTSENNRNFTQKTDTGKNSPIETLKQP